MNVFFDIVGVCILEEVFACSVYCKFMKSKVIHLNLKVFSRFFYSKIQLNLCVSYTYSHILFHIFFLIGFDKIFILFFHL